MNIFNSGRSKKNISYFILILSTFFVAPAFSSLQFQTQGTELDNGVYSYYPDEEGGSGSFSVFVDNFSVPSYISGIIFDYELTPNTLDEDIGVNWLVFRVFENSSFDEVWGPTQLDLWVQYEPELETISGKAFISLKDFSGQDISFGWSYITDGLENAGFSLYDIALIDEPSSLFYIFLVFILFNSWRIRVGH
ncbi:hypothetical protein [Lacimicrobium alkaliphilum]|uniref:Uncharacterized protein n=1 Tax=Lacimicrobium alkaliphilum TaxID=1526571 RepID=A0A0U2QQ97_9ALTE|nr:hypothetical protein [Lacimicrobium alkaliphilum]ALS99883.1 hypothetical protein AT746_17505 [Lacimicrobium alkaliphilum]